MIPIVHDTLPCGIEYAVVPLPHRHVVCFQLRILSGMTCEPADKLGLAHIVEETIDKGTDRYTGRELSDAFDAIGATQGIGAGRETVTFGCTVLPEHFERAVELQAETLRRPTFPEEAVGVAIELAHQELSALEDNAQGLLEKAISREAFGPQTGRHLLGSAETLASIGREDLLNSWKTHFCAGRALLAVSGAVEPSRVVEVFERHFADWGAATPQGRGEAPVEFTAGCKHRTKELEQQQIAICWPGVARTHPDFPIQQVMLGVLSGGMSGRLFTEVREKQGLVYWVSAWQETPRGSGMIFLGASTMPDRCDKTYTTLLREVDRLAEDLEQDELDRAVTGIVAHYETSGDSTRAKCAEAGSDLFDFGRPIPVAEKVDRVQAVTMEDVKRYLAAHPRDQQCVVTIGPRPLSLGSA